MLGHPPQTTDAANKAYVDIDFPDESHINT
jgi:hypothetical protein